MEFLNRICFTYFWFAGVMLVVIPMDIFMICIGWWYVGIPLILMQVPWFIEWICKYKRGEIY
jgi:hypothetical protein